ncbi:tetratricopeptide repeat protein 12 [Drosophila bipectinata]|uniref:tetratricopeptide repeat protein 12 n=1 Tax=Drosophila bipectinata TaxID=42026 RepID=UPI001C8AA1E0|nr:tetratricopeptide repeat protein 12 [Drosophila bipectinata]
MSGEENVNTDQLKATLKKSNLNAKDIDDFTEFEATLKKIQDILDNKDAPESSDPEKEKVDKVKEYVDFENLDVDKVRLKVTGNRTVINKKALEDEAEKETKTMNQQSFMEQVEQDANDRAEARAKREYEAEMLRAQGNDAFRSNKLEKAILLYGRAIEKIKDSAITYNNRALCYIKLRNFKRALQDCQYVLDKLQDSNLRAWLYKANAHKGLNQKEEYESSIAQAREKNPTQLAYIDKYIKQMEAEDN